MAISYYINAPVVAHDIAPVVTALLTIVTSNSLKMVITRQKNATAEANTSVTKSSKEKNDLEIKELRGKRCL